MELKYFVSTEWFKWSVAVLVRRELHGGVEIATHTSMPAPEKRDLWERRDQMKGVEREKKDNYMQKAIQGE